jgi:hypothetical protein
VRRQQERELQHEIARVRTAKGDGAEPPPPELEQLEHTLELCQRELAEMQQQFEMVEQEAALLISQLDRPLGRTAPALSPLAQKMETLARLGFAEDDCQLALSATRGDMDASAAWLFMHAPRRVPPSQGTVPPGSDLGEAGAARPSGPDQRALPPESCSEPPLLGPGLSSFTVEEDTAGAAATVVMDGPAAQWEEASLRPPPEDMQLHEILSLRLSSDMASLTVVDDYEGKDVPLLVVKVMRALASVTFSALPDSVTNADASLTAALACDYYNTSLSIWEPCLEAWPTTMQVFVRAFWGRRSQAGAAKWGGGTIPRGMHPAGFLQG